jgi:hypothetical protein
LGLFVREIVGIAPNTQAANDFVIARAFERTIVLSPKPGKTDTDLALLSQLYAPKCLSNVVATL